MSSFLGPSESQKGANEKVFEKLGLGTVERLHQKVAFTNCLVHSHCRRFVMKGVNKKAFAHMIMLLIAIAKNFARSKNEVIALSFI